MLIVEDILEKMKKHFPRWMDIRRKINSSIGGNYLSSIAEEISEVQSAIDDYKKDFFIDNYTGKEENILCFLYKVPIGILNDINSLSLIIPEYIITEDEDIFYDNDNYAYYNDGNLYFKNPEKEIIYTIDNFKYEGTYERINVWNIYDEFAIFLGLRRFENETNEELLNRIYNFSKYTINSSSDGLKNAILSNLCNIAPNLTKEDIKIERPTPDNLNKYYDQFETILDHLLSINKDVYKEKQWDIDTWNFDIKSIDYIPHAWDVALNSYVNGIGFKDDLKVEVIDSTPITDVTIYFYKKTIDYLNDYIKHNNIKQSFNFELIKYNEDIKETNVKYRIIAADTIKINPNEITFKSIEEKTGKINVNLEDIIYDESNLSIIDNSILDDNFNYEIDFIPNTEIGNFQINYCKQVDSDNNYINLLNKNYPTFISIGDGVRSNLSKKYIQDLNQLSDYENIKKDIYGFELIDLSKIGSMSCNIDGLNGYNLFYDYDNKETILDLNNFELENCYIYNNMIISDTVEGDKKVYLDLIANSFSCQIDGPYYISYKINNGDPIILEDLNNTNNFDFIIDKSNNSKDIKIEITLLGDNCRIKNVKYSKYEFNITTEKGSLIDRNGYNIIPNFDSNNLLVNVRVYAGFSPVIKYIYIGSKLTANNGYYGIKFNTDNGNKLLTKYSGCRLQLRKYTKDTNELIETIYEYKPYKEYTATKDTKVLLNLDNYSIDYIEALNCSVSKEIINKIKTNYYLTIPKDRSIIDLDIYGKYINTVIDQTLSSILNRKNIDIKEYNFHVTKNEDALIAYNKNTNKTEFIDINYIDIFSDILSSKLLIEVGSNPILTKFIISGINTYNDSIDTLFDYISFEPIQGNVYYAINEYNVVFPLTKDIEIVNTFNNSFDINSKNNYFYIVESLNDDFYVRFQTDPNSALCSNKTLDNQYILIKSKESNNLNYNYSIENVNIELPLSSTVEIPKYIYTNDNMYDIRLYNLNLKYKINYLNKYIDNDNYLDYIFTEEIIVNNNHINKLKYSNIYEIENITCNNIELTEGKDYQLLKDKGIIIWNENNIINKSVIVVTYNINVANSFDIELEDLYEQINYPINSLELLNTETITNVETDTSIDLSKYNGYSESDLISIKCSTPGFVSVIKDGILTLNNNTPENTVAVKTGYYYLNGREYYFASDEKYDSIDRNDYINPHNVIKDNNSYILKIKSQNFITNSIFDLNTKGEIYSLNCTDKDIETSSLLTELGICENYNYWTSFNCSLSIVEGNNGQALKFSSKEDFDGYCYLPLNTSLIANNKYKMSFYLTGDCKAYLGKEKNLNGDKIEFNYNSVIDIVKEIKLSNILDNVYETDFLYQDNDKYYLIVKGNGIIDDIILDKEDTYDIYKHIKVIDKLGFDFEEYVYPEYVTRLYLSDEYGAIFDGTEMNDENNIFNSSYIHWGYSSLKSLNSLTDFNSCILEDVDIIQDNNSCILKTGSKKGQITTFPIHLGNLQIINNILYKVNDVMFDYMKNNTIKVLTSNTKNAGYKEVYNSKDNIGIIDKSKLLSYIKLIVEIEPNKVINNIDLYVEYISDEKNSPHSMEVSNGVYTTKVLDTQYTERYLVKSINISNLNNDLDNYIFQIRASKLNDNDTVWTDWKTIELDENKNITNRITFIDYRYFQVRILLKGENTSLIANNIELEVI
jgi:hypothetical protein